MRTWTSGRQVYLVMLVSFPREIMTCLQLNFSCPGFSGPRYIFLFNSLPQITVQLELWLIVFPLRLFLLLMKVRMKGLIQCYLASVRSNGRPLDILLRMRSRAGTTFWAIRWLLALAECVPVLLLFSFFSYFLHYELICKICAYVCMTIRISPIAAQHD